MNKLIYLAGVCRHNIKSKTIYNLLGYLVFFSICLTDLLSINYPTAGRSGVFLWLTSYVLMVIYAARSFCYLISRLFKKIAVFTSLVIVCLFILLAVNIALPERLSGETCQETACAMRQLSTNDLGFNSTCFLGYPTRQYWLSSLPSLIKRNLVTLNLGGSLYFILGIIIFSAGSLSYLGENLTADLITALFMSFLLHFYWFNWFLFSFEQSIFPLSFALICCGILLKHLSKNKFFPAFYFGFALLYLLYSYTPGLSAFILGLSAIAYIFVSYGRPIQVSKLVYVFMFCLLLLLSVNSISHRPDLNIFGTDNQRRGVTENINDIKTGFTHLFIRNSGIPYNSHYVQFIFMVMLFLPIVVKRGFPTLYILIWCLATITFSVVSHGYAYYGVDFRLHRSMIILPVIISQSIYILRNMINDHNRVLKNLIIFLLFIFFLLSGISYHSVSLHNGRTEAMFYSTISNLPISTNDNATIYIIERDSGDYVSFNDFLGYFLPNTHSFIIEPKEDCSIPNDTQIDNSSLFLTSSNSRCFDVFQNTELRNSILVRANRSPKEPIYFTHQGILYLVF